MGATDPTRWWAFLLYGAEECPHANPDLISVSSLAANMVTGPTPPKGQPISVEKRAEGAKNKDKTSKRLKSSNEKEATDLTRQSLILTHRPHLIVRTLLIEEPSLGDRFLSNRIEEPTFKPGNAISGKITIINGGNSRAVVKRALIEPFTRVNPSACPESSFLHSRMMDWNSLKMDESSWRVRPDRRHSRRVGFCRRYERRFDRFVPVENDPDYEYAD